MRKRNRRFKLYWKNLVNRADWHIQELNQVKTPDIQTEKELVKWYLQQKIAEARGDMHKIYRQPPFQNILGLLVGLVYAVIAAAAVVPLAIWDVLRFTSIPVMVLLAWLKVLKAEKMYDTWFPDGEFAGFE